MSEAYIRQVKYECVQLSGVDAADFLARLCSADIKNLPKQHAVRALFLEGNAKMIAASYIVRLENRFVIVVEQNLRDALLEQFEKMHFAEQLEFSALESSNSFWLYHEGESALDEKFMPVNRSGESLLFATGMPSIVMAVCFSDDKFFIKASEFDGFTLYEDEQFWEEQRISALFPKYQKEWQRGMQPLDSGFLAWIDRDKGCYPGQEVVERSLNVGRPAKALVKLSASTEILDSDLELMVEGKEVGRITSTVRSANGEFLALAVVKYSYRAIGQEFSTSSGARFEVLA